MKKKKKNLKISLIYLRYRKGYLLTTPLSESFSKQLHQLVYKSIIPSTFLISYFSLLYKKIVDFSNRYLCTLMNLTFIHQTWDKR